MKRFTVCLLALSLGCGRSSTPAPIYIGHVGELSGADRLADEHASLGLRLALMDKEIRARIDEALSELSENHRSVLVMRELEGMSYEEMAQAMGCSKGTIMSRLFHARKNMQKRLADLFDRTVANEETEDAAASGSRG